MFHIQYNCIMGRAYFFKSTVPDHSSVTSVTLCLQFITLRSIPLIYKIRFFCLGRQLNHHLRANEKPTSGPQRDFEGHVLRARTSCIALIIATIYFAPASNSLDSPKGPSLPLWNSSIASMTQHSVGLHWIRDRPGAETCTWQHTTHKRQTPTAPEGLKPAIPASVQP
jgi:hypothetical protein